jgi:hypothetical protein
MFCRAGPNHGTQACRRAMTIDSRARPARINGLDDERFTRKGHGMAQLFGRSYSRRELAEHVGNIGQVAGVRIAELSDGFERGVRVADFRTGSGFEFSVLGDRGMDIAWASFCGASLAWQSPAPAAAPAFYEPVGLGWLRGFYGGLMVTCGLTYFGSPGSDEDQGLGLHGRASYIPATNFASGSTWQGDEYQMWVTGEIREASVFGPNLVLRRRISARLGEARLLVEDTVTNEGFEPAPHMILYHCNFGFPVVSAGTRLLVSSSVEPRDARAAEGMQRFAEFEAPTAGFAEQVYYHTPIADGEGYVKAALVNRAYGGGQGLGAYVRFPIAELPRLIEWKMMGQGHYVCGLEPSTNWVGGRAGERAAGRLTYLEPGESRHYNLEIGVLATLVEIDDIATGLPR